MRVSYAQKLGLAICALSVGISLLAVALFYSQTKENLWSMMSGRVRDVARTGVYFFDENDRTDMLFIVNQAKDYVSKQNIDSLAPGDSQDSVPTEKAREFEKSRQFQSLVQDLRKIK